jgi:hypothetical protein
LKIALAIAVCLLPSAAFAHGKSKSFAEWSFGARTAELAINFAGHDIAASVPGIDQDGDRALSIAELETMREVLGARTLEHTELAAAAEGAPVPCAAGPAEVKGLGDPVITEIQVRAVWSCEAGIGRVHVESRQLPELEPPHVTVATFLAGKTTAQHVFTNVAPAFELEVEQPSLARQLGATAIAGAIAMIAPSCSLFLLGLLLFETPRRTMVLFASWVAAFHIAGFLLPLAPRSWYALTFALAVAWAGFELMVRADPKLPVRKPVVAALFAAWFGAVLAPRVDLPNRLAFAFGETAIALLLTAFAAVVGIVLGDRIADYRRPVGIAWLCGAGALAALASI